MFEVLCSVYDLGKRRRFNQRPYQAKTTSLRSLLRGWSELLQGFRDDKRLDIMTQQAVMKMGYEERLGGGLYYIVT